MNGIPFIGEEGYYPKWARSSGRWLFQRTLVVIGQMLGDIALLHAAEVPVSEQMIVWAPSRQIPLLSMLPSKIHQERQLALGELGRLKLVCYGEKCSAPKPGSSSYGMAPTSVIRELGVQPNKWLLLCPSCGNSVGPDIASLSATPLLMRWASLGRPALENSAAGFGIQSATPVVDLPQWITQSQPSLLELAYLGQQMWPDIATMLSAMIEDVM
jgi:hypothetical protein